MRSVLIGLVSAAVLIGTFAAGIVIGQAALPQVGKSCDCRPCPCSRGDGRRTGQPTGDVAPEEKGGDR